MDLFEQFVAGLAETPKAGNEKQEQASRYVQLPARVGRHKFREGYLCHSLRVVAPAFRPGKWGPLSRGEYIAECVAPSGKDGAPCGKKVRVTYHQLYYKSVRNCGCVKIHKHPPIHLEDAKFGSLDVLFWDEATGRWECVCRECGAVMQRKRIREIKRAGESCEHA